MNKTLFLVFGMLLSACSSAPWSSDRALAAKSVVGRTEMERIAFGDLPKIHTDAVLILKDGEILYERYARGYSAESKHLSWSMAKTIAGLIASQAIAAGKMNLADPVARWIPEYKGSATLLDLFQMSSGIAYKEEYSGVPVDSDATKMLYLKGVETGFAGYTLKLPPRSGVRPGDHFYYSSGDANLIMEALKRSLGDRAVYDAFPWSSFFDRLGMPNATFEQDSQGTFAGSSYVYLTAREYARIGQMLANRGQWKSETILSPAYFEALTQVAPGVMRNALPGTSPSRAYSMQATTNLPITGRGRGSEYADLPTDSILMIGHQGQLVIASPSENLVIVRLATDAGDPFNAYRPEFFAAIRRFLTEDLGLPLAVAGPSTAPETTAAGKKGKAPIGDYLKVPRLIRALHAKELCSCRFVERRSAAQCREDLKLSLPVLSIAKIDEKLGWVTTRLASGAKSRAVYHGPKLGCTLVR